ncbi:MAG: hypothetical protein ACYDCQ_20745 [Dehalococcoidia bacterium]
MSKLQTLEQACVPLSAPDHMHHARARRYWENESADKAAFCGVTALAYLAAFALAGGYRLVAFDSDYLRFDGLNLPQLAV